MTDKPKRKKKPPKPRDSRDPHQSIMLVVTKDGTFAPADDWSRKVCKDRAMRVGNKYVAYLYEPRDIEQWRTAHAVAGILALNVDEFMGMDNHTVLKAIQVAANVEMDEERIDLGKLGVVTRSVPRTLAFGFLENTRWVKAWRQMATHIGVTYFGMLDANVVEELQKLVPLESAA